MVAIMSSEYLPIQYRVEIYEQSFENTPTVAFHANNCFQAIRPGDYVSHFNFGTAPYADMKSKVLIVKAVQHILFTIKDAHVGHSLSVLVEAVPTPPEFS